MKICIFADGQSIHTQRWCKHFHSLGHQVDLISFKDISIENINVHLIEGGNINVNGGNWRLLFHTLKVKRKIKEISPNIVHSLYATSYGIIGALCGFHPYVITALGSDVLVSPKQSSIYRVLLKFAFRKADWITAMADHMKKAIEDLGVPSSKVSTVPFGIDPLIFNDENRLISENEFVITSTRNFEDIYNIPHLIKAVSKIKDQIPGIKLNLIGDGSLRSEIEEMVDSFGLKPFTTFYGKIPQPQIASILRGSNLFISVSLSDGNNISLNEAMACGTYSIVTNIAANQQWIENGENGFLVEIDDVEDLASKILKVKDSYTDLVNNARNINHQKIQDKGIWSVNMEKVEQGYKRLVSL